MTDRASALEVNEAAVWATNRGADWWNDWRARMEPAGRITVITSSAGGDRVLVACDSRDDAAWLRDHMVSRGIPPRAVTIRSHRNDLGTGQCIPDDDNDGLGPWKD